MVSCYTEYPKNVNLSDVAEKRLFPFGSDAQDTEVTSLSGLTRERVSELIAIPDGWPMFDGILHNNAYVGSKLI